MGLGKNEMFVRGIVHPLIKRRINGMFQLEITGLENLNVGGQPLLIMAKHSSDVYDIMIEELLLKDATERSGYYIMKQTLEEELQKLYGPKRGRMLYSWLMLSGGIPVIREEDMRIERASKLENVVDAEERKRIKREGMQAFIDVNRAALDYVSGLYEKNEIVVLHPEGRTYPGSLGPLASRPYIDNLLKNQIRLRKFIPVIPLGFQYEDMDMKDSRVTVSIGGPRIYLVAPDRVGEVMTDLLLPIHFYKNSKDIGQHIMEEIGRLSGL